MNTSYPIKNKRRWLKKLNGLSNKDYCQGCLSYHCDPMSYVDSIANRKRMHRRRLGLCEGCGKKECKCKNRGR